MKIFSQGSKSQEKITRGAFLYIILHFFKIDMLAQKFGKCIDFFMHKMYNCFKGRQILITKFSRRN